MVEVGKELEKVETELRNIIFIAEKTVPADKADPRSGEKMMAEMAKRALKYLAVSQITG